MNRRHDSQKIFFLGGVFFAFLFAGLSIYIMRRFVMEDALIYHRYIFNCLNGDGLVYNKGEYVNALTSPFYTYVSLLTAYVSGNISLSQIVLGGTFLFGASVSAMLLLRRSVHPMIPALTATFIVTGRLYYITFGMETTLFVFLLGLTILFYVEGRYSCFMISGALLFLTRGEGIFLIVALALFHYLEDRKFPPWKVYIVPALLLSVHFLFNLLYYRALFPHTFAAKIYHGRSDIWGRWSFLEQIVICFRHNFGDEALLMSLVSITAVIGIAANVKETPTKSLVSFCVLLTGFYVALRIPGYHWYIGPYIFAIYILFGLGVEKIRLTISKTLRTRGPLIGWAVSGLMLGFVLWRQVDLSWKDRGLSGKMDYTEIGMWLKENTPADASVACCEIGHIGWYSQRRIVDIAGLVSPRNALWISEGKLSECVEYYKPTYILLHDPPWRLEEPIASAAGSYDKVEPFKFPKYILLQRNAGP